MPQVIKKLIGLISLTFLFLMLPSTLFSQGSNYNGPYETSPPLVYTDQKNIVIEGLEFTNTDSIVSDGRCITLTNCENVIIRNCKFKNVPLNAAIYANGSSNITVTNCVFENVQAGLRGHKCEGGIKFENNDLKNIVGDLSGGSRFSQAVQFDKCNGPDNSISYNVIENIPGESSPEDVINIFHSNGTAESPIIIRGNWIRGGGPSGSGGGILIGDWGGSYQIIENNILVDPGQYGLQIAGGHNMTIRNNKVYGRQQPFSNVGLVIVNWTSKQTGPSYNITVENNRINWTNRDGVFNTAWFAGNMQEVVSDSQKEVIRDPSITQNILPEVILNSTEMDTP